ncbi:MAG: hypothetical protein U9Q81_05835 [Pseudomonadota bacterium]|nr:hypothetical protein [Pseudomonadota bacterium]
MKDIWKRLVLFVHEQWSRIKTRSAARRRYETEINLAVERVVDQVNPRLRAVSGYRRKLFPVVERALEHVRELSLQVPGPVRVDRQAWAGDAMINALFGSVKRMRWVLTGPDVRKYVKEHPIGGDCYAVLAAMPEVRNQLGMELRGETVQRDVRQTAVSFSNHEVALVGEAEQSVREALAHDALELLVSLAVQDIVGQESRIAETEERLRILRLKQKVAKSRSRGVELLLDESAEHLKEQDELRGRIAELETDLPEVKKGLESLDDYLKRLIALLEHPESHLGLEQVRVRLDRMNIVREGPADSSGSEIEFTRALRGDQPGRVVAIIRFPRSELLEESDRLREVERYLG